MIAIVSYQIPASSLPRFGFALSVAVLTFIVSRISFGIFELSNTSVAPGAVRTLAKDHNRNLSYGIRLHVIARDTSQEAWAVTRRLLAQIMGRATGYSRGHDSWTHAGDLSRGVQARDARAVGGHALAVEVGLETAERLAGQDVEAYGDQWSVGRVEDLVRLRDADQPVRTAAAGVVDRHDLHVLGLLSLRRCYLTLVGLDGLLSLLLILLELS